MYLLYFDYCRNMPQKYEVFPIIDSLIKNNILSDYANIYMSGGEPTIAPEFEKLFSCLANYIKTKIEVFTSGIKYSSSIEDAFKKNRVRLLISLDSSSPEVFKQIKKVDAFDTVISNIKRYIEASDSAKENIILKYIVIDDVNDNESEMYNFLDLVASLGVENVVYSFDYVKYRFDLGIQIPDKYIDLYIKFNEYAKQKGLFVESNTQVEALLKRDYSTIVE